MEDVERKEEDMSVDQNKPPEESELQTETNQLKTADVPDAQTEKDDSQDSDKTEEADDSNTADTVENTVTKTSGVTTDDSEKKDDKGDEKAEKKEDDKEDKEDDEDEDEVEEVIVLEDIEDDGEDPSEVEVEKFNQPSEHMVLNDLAEIKTRRKVIINPLKISELSHPVLLEAIGKSSEFRTCFVQSVTDNRPVWTGSAEINFRSSFVAAESLQSLKTIREDITVRCLEAGETTKNTDSHEANKKLISSVLIVKAVAEDATIDSLREVFSSASDIVIPQNQKPGKRMAYAIYDGEELLDEVCKTFVDKQPEIDGKPLRVYKFQPSADMPTGLLKMKRRYRILLQMDKLKKAIKDKKANHTKNVKNMMSSTIQHCKSLIEKDDAIRKELGFSVYNLAELRRYKRIREAIKEDTIWLPGKKMHGPDRRGFLDDEDEEDRHKRYARMFASDKSDGGIPSLMSVAVDLKFTPPILRPHAPLARMGPIGPPLGPPGPGMPLLPMRGGPGGPGPRGLARGGPRGMVRGGPGSFRGGRGGFHDGPPPPPEEFNFESSGSYRGRRGGFDHGFGGDRGFGRGGYGRGGEGGGYGRGGRDGGGYGRGGDGGGYSRGGNDDGFSRGEGAGYGRGGDSGYGRGGFNKRPRSPPGGGSGSRGYRGTSQDNQDSTQHASKMPRKDSDDARESRWSSGRQDSRGNARGGRGGYRQGQDNSNWSKPTGSARSDNSNTGYGKSGYSGSGSNVSYGQPPSGGATNSYNPATNVAAPPVQNNYNTANVQTGTVNTNMSGYGQQAVQQPAANMSGYGQAGSVSNMTGYGQQATGMGGYDQTNTSANAYNQVAASTGYGQTAYGQAGYGQAGVTGYGQTQDPNAAAYGYTQPVPASTDYYQTAASSGYQTGMVTYPPVNQAYQTGAATTTPQQPAAGGTTATGWGMQQQQQPAQQQYWTGDQSQQQPTASWPTGAEGTASATVDPNAAAAYGYNWAAAAGWKQ